MNPCCKNKWSEKSRRKIVWSGPSSSIIKKLEINLSKYIFGLHEEQYILSSRYLIDPADLTQINLENSQLSYRVMSIDSNDKKHFRLVKLVDNKYSCECETYIINVRSHL